MAGKTLINSVAYENTEGKTLVGGTAYDIKVGKTLIGGTAYDIGSTVLPPALLDLWPDGYRFGRIIHANGYWVAVGSYSDGSNYYCAIAYSVRLNGPWTTKTLWGGATHSSYVRGHDIVFANGYWVVVGRQLENSTYYARMAYATSLDGTWTTKDLWSATKADTFKESECNGLTSIIYANGYFVVTGEQYSSSTTCHAKIAYATTPGGAWSTKNLWSGTGSVAYCVTYANGYWVVGGRYAISSSIPNARIAYATSLDGTWTTKNLWSSAKAFEFVKSITYANGYWVACGAHYQSSTYNSVVAYSTSPGGTWTRVSLWTGDESCRAEEVVYINGCWVVCGLKGGCISYAITPNGTWTHHKAWTSSAENCGLYSIIYDDGYWVAVGAHYISGTGYIARMVYAQTIGELGQNG